MAGCQRGHTRWLSFLLPSRLVPLLGAAYSRACEYTCDAMGSYYGTQNLDEAIKAVQLLSSGHKRWADKIDRAAYEAQARTTNGFFATVAELNATHSFTIKRVLHLRRFLGEEPLKLIPRNVGWAIMAPFMSVTFWMALYVVIFVSLVGFAIMEEGFGDDEYDDFGYTDYTEQHDTSACNDLYAAYQETDWASLSELDAYRVYAAECKDDTGFQTFGTVYESCQQKLDALLAVRSASQNYELEQYVECVAAVADSYICKNAYERYRHDQNDNLLFESYELCHE